MSKKSDIIVVPKKAVTKNKKRPTASNKQLVRSDGLVDPLIQYMSEINKYDLLTLDQEKELTEKLFLTF